MNQAWRIVRKDFSRLWLPWSIWIMLAVADVVLGSRLLQGDLVTRATQYESDAYRKLVETLLMALGYILAAWLVQLDCPEDSEAEWMTRPISGPILFTAKLLGVVLLLCVPQLLIAIIWWGRSGIAPGQMPYLALVNLTQSMAVALPAVFLASLSKDWARFLVFTLGVLGLGIVVSQLVGPPDAILLGLHAYAQFPRLDSCWILVAAAMAATFAQFAYRRPWRSCGLAVIGILASTLNSGYFERPVGGYRFDEGAVILPRTLEVLPKGIRVSFEHADIFADPRLGRRHRGFPTWMQWPLSLSLRINGTPAGEMFRYGIFDGELYVPGLPGMHEQWFNRLEPENNPAALSLAVLGKEVGAFEINPHLMLWRSIAAKALDGPTSLHGKIYLHRLVSTIEARLPVASGSKVSLWGSTFTVVSTKALGFEDNSGDNRAWGVTSLVNVMGPAYPVGTNQNSNAELGGFVFWNVDQMQAVYATDSTLVDTSVQGVRLERRSLTAIIPFGKDSDSREKADKWIAGSELVWIQFESKQYYWTPLDVSNLQVRVGRNLP